MINGLLAKLLLFRLAFSRLRPRCFVFVFIFSKLIELRQRQLLAASNNLQQKARLVCTFITQLSAHNGAEQRAQVALAYFRGVSLKSKQNDAFLRS